MASDELIWGVINHNFCAFKARVAETRTFCRNPENVTGQCDRRSCPLANSRYATVKEEKGRAVLYVKTAERAHTPKKLWEKTVLPRNYTQALEVLDKELEYWPVFMLHKNKQRLTKIHQVLIRSRKLLKETAPSIERVHQKDERREKKREAKALVAAKLERTIEKELLNRLKEGTYGEIYNYPSTAYERALKSADANMEENKEYDEDDIIEAEDDEEAYEDDDGDDADDAPDYYEGDLTDEDDEDDDMEDYYEAPKPAPPPAKRAAPVAPAGANAKRAKPSGPYVEIEFENEEHEREYARATASRG